jgi:pyruvate/2-oxoglutarate dehydrogenase complex dihydrolipoamide acyltransferase (E2) component
MKKTNPAFRRIPLTFFRKLIIDGVDVGMKKHYMKGFFELDVTETRRSIREYRRKTKKPLSFISFFIYCIARALSEHKSLNAGLKRNRIIIFEDIDVSVAVEMDLNGEKVPRLIVIREAQNKSMQQIHGEIETAQRLNREKGDVVQGEEKNLRPAMLVMRLPKFVRGILWSRLLRDPFFTKRMMGTVGITAIGMFGSIAGWPEPIPTSNHAVSFALGSITKKPRVFKGKVLIREILHVTILMDHDIVDGAPGARFTERLRQLVEKGLD